MTEAEIVALIGMAGMIVVAIINAVAQHLSIKRRLDKMEEHDKEQYLDILRLTIMSPDIPVSERIIAGKKYIKLGGNGDVKKYFEEFLKKHTK